MDKRYKPIAWVAGGLFLVNLLANFIARVAFNHNDAAETYIGVIGFTIVGLTFLVFSYLWAIRFPLTRAIGEILLTWSIACLASVLIGPFAAWTYPFASGPGNFFQGIWIYGAVALGASALGILGAFAVGKDYRAQALKRFSSTAMAKPRRPVRR